MRIHLISHRKFTRSRRSASARATRPRRRPRGQHGQPLARAVRRCAHDQDGRDDEADSEPTEEVAVAVGPHHAGQVMTEGAERGDVEGYLGDAELGLGDPEGGQNQRRRADEKHQVLPGAEDPGGGSFAYRCGGRVRSARRSRHVHRLVGRALKVPVRRSGGRRAGTRHGDPTTCLRREPRRGSGRVLRPP